MSIEEIKKLQKKGYRRWSEPLIPHCHELFKEKYPITYIENYLNKELHIDVSLPTIRSMKKRWAATQQEQSTDIKSDVIKSVITSKSDIPTTQVVKEPVATTRTRKLTIEEAAANMDRFYQRQDNPRFEIDDIIEQQQKRQQKL